MNAIRASRKVVAGLIELWLCLLQDLIAWADSVYPDTERRWSRPRNETPNHSSSKSQTDKEEE